MATVPIRDLGKYGVIADTAPYDLPLVAWSDARNVRFQDNAVRRFSAPFKVADATTLLGEPRHLTSGLNDTNVDRLVMVSSDYHLYDVTSGSLEDKTGSLDTGASEAPVTSCTLAGFTIVNRETNPPRYRETTVNADFAELPNWPEGWRAKTIRSFRDFLVAGDVTQGVTRYPTMFAWSDATTSGSLPATWIAAENNLAGSTILHDVTPPIIDTYPLRGDVVIYTHNEATLARYIGDPFIFSFDRVFNDDGVMGPNCVVEINGQHFVFGTKDIYMHDGVSKRSIVQGRVHRRVYHNLDFSKRRRCFIWHDPRQTEIGFAYPSTCSGAYFPETKGCNEAAVYNYVDDTWTFVDLPNCFAAGLASLNTRYTWSTGAAGSWNQRLSSWRSQTDPSVRSVMLASSGVMNVPKSVLALDDIAGGDTSFDFSPIIIPPAYALREKIDMDELGAGIGQKKWIRRIYPQARALSGEGRVGFAIGRSEHPNDLPVFGPTTEFDPRITHKIDTRLSHRYLSLRYELLGGSDGEFSGLDVDFVPISRR